MPTAEATGARSGCSSIPEGATRARRRPPRWCGSRHREHRWGLRARYVTQAGRRAALLKSPGVLNESIVLHPLYCLQRGADGLPRSHPGTQPPLPYGHVAAEHPRVLLLDALLQGRKETVGGDVGPSERPKHWGRCLATLLGAPAGWRQESKAATGGVGAETEAVGPPAGSASHSQAALLLD